jgi:hypothetical protein
MNNTNNGEEVFWAMVPGYNKKGKYYAISFV